MADIDVLREEINALENDADPRPWEIRPGPPGMGCYVFGRAGDKRKRYIGLTLGNVKFLTALRNAWPTISAALARKDEEIERLRESVTFQKVERVLLRSQLAEAVRVIEFYGNGDIYRTRRHVDRGTGEHLGDECQIADDGHGNRARAYLANQKELRDG